jgi:drug/metabolite transporter (DMT)-like permease
VVILLAHGCDNRSVTFQVFGEPRRYESRAKESGVMSKDARPVAGIVLTVAAMVSLASADAIAKHLTLTYAIIQILWIRYVLYAAFGVGAAYREAGRHGFVSRNITLQLVRATLLVVANVVIVFSFSRLPLADVHAVIAVAPLAVTAASVVCLHEVVEGRRWIAIAFGFTGVLLIVKPGIGVFDPIALTPLAGAALYTCYQILTKLVTRNDGAGTTQFYTGLVGLFWFTLAVPFVWKDPALGDWVWLCAAAIAGTMAHVLIVMGLNLAPASTVQPFNYAMLVAAAIFGYLFFDEVPDLSTVMGACIVVGAGLYVIFLQSRTKARP